MLNIRFNLIKNCNSILLSTTDSEEQNVVPQWESPGPGLATVAISERSIEWPELVLSEYSTVPCSRLFSDDWFSCLAISFRFKRRIRYHIAQTFLPTFAFALVSWLSFWLDYSLAGLKMSIALTVLLTLTTLSNAIRANLPPAEYLKACGQ